MRTHHQVNKSFPNVRIFWNRVFLFLCLSPFVFAQTAVPLKKTTIIKLVQTTAKFKPEVRVAPTQEIIKAIQQNGVDFKVTKSTLAQLRKAGAGTELISVIRNNYRPPTQVARKSTRTTTSAKRANTTLAKKTPPPPPPPSYEEYLSRAERELAMKNFSDGIAALMMAIRRDPTKPTAYEWLAEVQYQVMDNKEAAAEAMHAALARGGTVRFRIAHFHNMGVGCYGELVIRPSSVSFETDNSNDRFLVGKDGIYENWMRDDGELHLRIRKSDGGARNFNFSTKTRFESQLIVELIKQYQ